MDDELELTDPDHPDAQEAAAATARLLIAIHDSRRHPSKDGDPQSSPESKPDDHAP
jgi:hypothetical protein